MSKTVEYAAFQRNDKLIKRKFYQFMLPAVLSVAIVNMSDFLDSLVIAQTLGQEAMSMINLASPIMLIFSTIYTFLGMGGSIVYAYFKGKMEDEKASEVFSVSLYMAALVSIVILLAGLSFLNPIVELLSNGLNTPDTFTSYVRVVFISTPCIILLPMVLIFLPAQGHPQISTVINIITCVTNIIFDIIFTTIGHMPVAGAAWATLIGYSIGILILVILWLNGRCSLPLRKITKNSLNYLKEIAEKGCVSAAGQLGFCVKIIFSNYIAALYAGSIGIAVFSICNQTNFITSIFLAGILDAMIPILSVLLGRQDYQGIRLLMKNVIRIELVISAAMFMIFELFPTPILHAFGILTKDSLAFGTHAIRIFAFMYIFRQSVLTFMYYAQVTGRKYYSFILGIIEGFVGIIVLAEIFTGLMGIDGLWLAYSVYTALMLLGIYLINRWIVKKSGGTLKGFFLLPENNKNADVISFSLYNISCQVSEFTEDLTEMLQSRGIGNNKAMITAIACEELWVYTNNQTGKERQEIDIQIHICDDELQIDFTSIGPPFSPIVMTNESDYSNLAVLNRLAKKIEYGYVIGMNQTRIIL